MKKLKLLAAAALVIAAGTFFLTSENSVKADVSKEVVIQDGVYIGGIDVSGMTAEEATTAVDTYVAGLQEQWITLVGPKNTLRYQLKDLGLSVDTEAAVQEAIALGNSGSIIKRFMDLEDLEKEDYVVDMGLGIDKQLTANKIYGKRSKIDIKAIDNSLKKEKGKFVYVPGQEGNEVDIVTAVNELNEYIGADWEIAAIEDAKFTLTSIVSQPRGTEEELAVIKDLLGTYTTDYGWSAWGRGKNVENGTSKMNGIVVYPGDVFSVYENVTPFTKENGYELAGSFSNGDTVQTYGGGICQVVTTLYQAVLQAELEVVERFNHSMVVGYTPLGGDAAISGTYKDFKFRNNTDTPVFLETYCKNGNIVINIYGVETRPDNRKVIYESETISETDPDTEFTLSSAHPVGSFIQTRSESIGYVAKFWKIVKVDGVETEKTLVNKSTYRSSCRKVTIGTAGATAEQLAAINAAIATKDDAQVEAVVASFNAPPATTTPDAGTTTPNTGTTTPDSGTTKPDSGNTTDTETTKPDAGTTTEQPSKPDTGNGDSNDGNSDGENNEGGATGSETPETGNGESEESEDDSNE